MHIRAIPIIIFLFCTPLCVTAQKAYSQTQKDSLNQGILLKTSVLEIAEYMHSLFSRMEKLPREEAIAWSLNTVGFCKQHNLQTTLTYAYINAGRIDNSANAYQWFHDALQQAKEIGSDKVLMEAHFRLANFQEQKFIKEEAYKNMLITIGYARELKDTAAQRGYLIDFVSFHFRDGNYKRTIEIGKELLIMFQQEGMQTIEKRGELWMVMSLYNTFGMAYKALAEFDSAHVNYDRAAKIAYYIKDEFWIGLVAGNKGEAYVAEGCYQEGLPGLKKDIWISKKYKSWESTSYSMVTVGRLYISIGDVARANAYMDSAKSIHDKYIPQQPIPLQYWLLSADVEFEKGHYEKARQIQKDYIADQS